MLSNLSDLISRARSLPGEIKDLAFELLQKRHALDDLKALREELEANNSTEALQESNEMLYDIRYEIAQLESKLEALKHEHQTVVALIHLVAGVIQAGNQSVVDAVLGNNSESDNCKPDAPPASGRIPNENEQEKNKVETGTFKVLETKPSKKGIVFVYCEGPKGKVVFAAKDDAAKVMSDHTGKLVVVKYRRLQKGLYAVSARPA